MSTRIGSYFADGVGRIVGYVPQLVSAILILAIGYGVAVLFRLAARRLLHGVGFDRFVERHVHRKAASQGSPSDGVGVVAFWLTLLTTFTLASRALGLDALAAGLSRILGYIPHVLVACVIVVVGAAVARLIAELVADMSNRTVANLARGAVIGLSIFMALDELQVAHGIVLTTFALLVGAVSVATAIAFGLGNRDLAAHYTRRFVRSVEAEPPLGPTIEQPPHPPLEPLPPDVHH